MEKILVTGTGGFIGFHLAKKLLAKGYEVVGLDELNNYYDVNIKYHRLEQFGIPRESIQYNRKVHGNGKHSFYQLRLQDKEGITGLFQTEKFDYVINLAAQAGVRYSLENPYTYVESNLNGFITILEGCRHHAVKHLIYASSSSVYGMNTQLPFSVNHNVDHPISLYAVSKKANELMAHCYSNLFKIPSTGLRFFTVYGPWGRPDMALFIFTKAIIAGEPINVYNNGEMQRDFTYVDDIVESIVRLVPNIPSGNPEFNTSRPDPATSSAPYRVFNIGNNSPVPLMDFVHAIEEELGRKAIINFLPLQPGDVPSTYADVESLFEATDFRPKTNIRDGIRNFVQWYREYYKV